MKIQVTQINLNRALSLLSRVASTKTPLQILSNVIIRTVKGSLEIAATNLEVAITHTTKGKIDSEGSITVPARLLSDFVSQLPKDQTVTINMEKEKLFISAGAYKSHIQSTRSDDFPALPTIENAKNITLLNQTLKDVLTKTMLAASHDETRPILGGILFKTYGGKLFIAATDGYRLAESYVADTDATIEVVVPLPTVQDVLRITQDAEEDTSELQFEESQFGLRCGDTQLVSRVVDGQYPEYRQLIPAESDIHFTVDRSSLLTAAKLAGLFARESGGSITIKASEIDKGITVSSVATQVGDNTSSLDADVSGSGEVVLNVRYLIDALNCFDAQDINFRFSGAISPCVLTDAEKSDNSYQHIVMPLKS